MIKLNLPEIKPNLKKDNGKIYIFDPVRRKYIYLTPEEWVRQHFLDFLITHKAVPRGLVKIEEGTSYHILDKRTDILVYSREALPLLLVECKAPSVKNLKMAADQVAVYNKTLNARYLVITNGIKHYFWDTHTSNQITNLEDMPAYTNLAPGH